MRRFLVLAIAVTACARPLAEPPEPSIAFASPRPAADIMETPAVDVADEPSVADVPPRPARTIYRSELERALRGGPAYLLYQLGPEPFRGSGQFVGWKITRLFPGDPTLCADDCDLRIGDVILAIEGNPLRTPEAFGELVGRAHALETLEVTRLRDQKRHVVTYTIAPDR